MRLRFIISRHTLPLTPVVLNIQPNLTVAQALEEINAVIPLESGEWGLDDYAVELPGEFGVNFECLHYEKVGEVMKADDEVIIRPLSSQDLNIRKVSGRHQISSDGRHLVDGVAFGRQYPRERPERPDINIPPRKRLRLQNGEHEDEDEDEAGTLELKRKLPMQRRDPGHGQDSNKQLILNADFDDDSEDDEDFVPREEDNDDDNDSIEDYDDEGDHPFGADGDHFMEDEEGEPSQNSAEEPAFGADGDQDLEDEEDEPSQNNTEDNSSNVGQNMSPRNNLRKLHSAFPTSPFNVCKNVLSASNGDLAKAYDSMTQGFQPAKTKSAITEAAQGNLLIPKTRSKKPKVAVSEPENLDDEPEELDESIDPLLEYYDQNGLPPGSIMSGTALSHMADVLKSTGRAVESPKGRVASNKIVHFADDIPTNGLTSTRLPENGPQVDDSEEESEEDTSSGDDTSSSDEESDNADISEASSSGTDSDSSDDESDSGSSSDSDSAPEETSSKTVPASQEARTEDAVVTPTAENQKTVRPGEGRKGTKARNTRRRNAKALQRLQEQGILPLDTTATEFNKLDINAITTMEDALAALDAIRSAPLSDMNDDFQARRQQLLDSLESGGIEVGHEPSTKASKPPSVAKAKPIATKDVEETAKDATADISAQSIVPPAAQPDDASTPPSRRSRLDLGAGRRLLFGALGIKTPKSKLDEEKIRNNLMKDVRPLVTPKPDEPAQPANDEELNEDPDAWKESITYRAVECCHDDVELSEPPFPFVQRWDPQQQGHRSKQGKNGGKRKKDQRDDTQYYDSNQRSSKKQKLGKSKHGYAEEQEYLDGSYEPSYQEDSTVIDYDQDSVPHNSNAENGASSQLLNDLNYTESADSSQVPTDLAPLPEDPTTLPDLKADQVTTGMTIAFKQLIMSEETKWQPQISAYRTAIVIANPENGELHLTLALRDRKQPERFYDEQTGDRIYGRFDMPVEHEDEEELEDDGMLTVGFGELIEPKIVQNAPDSLILDAATDDITSAVSSPKSAYSSALSKAIETTEDQFSHVPETLLHSEIPESILSVPVINHSEQESIAQEGEVEIREAERQGSAQIVDARLDESQQPAPLSGPKVKTVGDDNAEIAGTPPPNVTEAISDEARHEISFMMKEAGFRSSVPSSIRRDIRPEGMESPGDAAVFDKLMKDMTEIENHFPSSPKFNGFDSSPPPRPSGEAVNPPADILRRFSSSPAPPPSSWQTIPFDEPSSPPAKTQEPDIPEEASDGIGDSWETVDPSVLTQRPNPRKTKRKLHMAPSIQKANQVWEQFSRPNGTGSSAGSPIDSVKDGQEFVAPSGLNSNASVGYPKLSVGSSFTSQITDHGRQPDVVFDDSTALYGDVTKTITEESSVNHDNGAQQPDDSVSDAEPELPSHAAENLPTSTQRRRTMLMDLPSSDDDLFPPLEVVLSQRNVKPEVTTKVLSKGANKDGQELNVTTTGDSSLSSEESDYATPKPAQNSSRASRRSTSQRSNSQPNPRTRSSVARSSETPASKSKAKKFVVPQGSQVMDLTISSEAEEEQSSLDARIPVFRRYQMASDDDDDYNDSGENGKKGGGWVNKKASSQVEAPKRTATRLRSSSQASSNPKSSRKKTVARF